MNEFTPFGYLRNPSHQATTWADTRGGNLRTSPEVVGVEWAYPVGREPKIRVGLGLETTLAGRSCRTRAEFDALRLTSRYHSCSIMGFDWATDEEVSVEARYFLATAEVLVARVSVENRAIEARLVSVGLIGRLGAESVHGEPLTEVPVCHVVVGVRRVEACFARGERRVFMAALARGPTLQTATASGQAALADAESVYRRLLREDAIFWSACPTLSGDWPARWAEGLHHDFETTRLLVQPAGGIFTDIWPSWMAAWPRAVLAEGTLDMLRLAFADPTTAQRAVLSLFRDAPGPNIPCVFVNGEYNMLAADGTPCGTSPSWCLPFLNLELLYLRTLDRDWLAQIHPLAAAFVDWWLVHRADAEGWLVYKCSWESGEDDNPRLDPSRSGDADISRRVRPVELQAAMAHAAGVLALFGTELGAASAEVARWRQIERDFRQRTRQLFDADAGRYRDWLIGEERFQEPCPSSTYWDVDACRYGAQSLLPLLVGEPLAEEEVWRHATPPWTLWPSWTHALVESAAAARLYRGIGALAFETIDRVYRVTTRRDVLTAPRPMPGTAPEYWPLDWRTFAGNDAYGWGATTANLLIRHLFGFKESRRTDGWVAELTPALPRQLLVEGAQYGIRHLNYRGLRFDLSYTVVADDLLVELDLGQVARECRVREAGEVTYQSVRAATQHQFRVRVGGAFEVWLP